MASMYTVGELAALMEVDAETIRRWRYRGRNGVFLECLVGQGKQGHRITAEALERFLEVNPGLMTEALKKSLYGENTEEAENDGKMAPQETFSQTGSLEVDPGLRTAQAGDSDNVAVLKSILDERCRRREQLERDIQQAEREIRTLVDQIRREQERTSLRDGSRKEEA